LRFQSDELVALRGFIVEVARSLLPRDAAQEFADLEAEVAASQSLERLRQAAQEWIAVAQSAGLSVPDVDRLDAALQQRNLPTFSDMRAARYEQLCHLLGRGTAETEAELRLATSFLLDVNSAIPTSEERHQVESMLQNAAAAHLRTFVRNFVAENRQQRWIHLLTGGGRNLARDGSHFTRYLIDAYCEPIDSVSALRPDAFGVFSDFHHPSVWLRIDDVWENHWDDGLFVFDKGQRAVYFHHSDGRVLCQRDPDQT